MINRQGIIQKPHQIIDIADWPAHNDYEVFPEGARDKTLRVCPNPVQHPMCLPEHQYLFKESIKSAKHPGQPRYPDQYWAEVIAFRIGRLMGLELPPVFIAIDSSHDEPGTINEWFTGYPGGSDERYFPGGDFMQRLINDYDRDKGREHNLTTILSLSKQLSRAGVLVHDWQAYWGLCLCFDALIGNTDRHQENWGLIWARKEEDGGFEARYTPYFDNGTSLGHELQPSKMQRMMRDRNELNAYLRRGAHQMRWAKADKKRMPLIESVARYCQSYPHIRALLRERLEGWSVTDLENMLLNYTHFNLPHPLTEQRAEFVAYLTQVRKEHLLQALEN